MKIYLAALLAFVGGAFAPRSIGDHPVKLESTAIVAERLYTVADDFVIDIYHNGRPISDERRTLLEEIHGATAERVDAEVREGDWIVFNVVNNRLRWGGCSYFGVAGRGRGGVAFTTNPEDASWSYCDDPAQVTMFINDPDYLSWQRVQPIENPWSEGDALMSHIADGWSGEPVWGKRRNTWIKYRVPSRTADGPR